MNAPATSAASIDRELLLAILATQANLVTPQTVLTALHAWMANPEQPLVAVLLEQGALSGEARSRLDGLMARYLQTHGEVPTESGEAGRRATLRWFIQLCRALDFAESRGPLPLSKPAVRGPSDMTSQPAWEREPVERLESPPWPGALNHPERLQNRSAGFLCPEAAEGATTAAAHVYGLGVVLYSLLTGQRPFADAEQTAVLERVRRGDFWPPRTVQPTVSPALEAICLKAMAREPAQRYASPKALADELDRWLAHEPLVAYAPPLLQRWRYWGKRHRALATTATLVMAMAALVAGVVLLDQARHVFARDDGNAGRYDAYLSTGASRSGDEGRWLRTRDVLGSLTTRVLEDWLEDDTPLSPQQRHFLEVAFAFYNLFSQDAGTDPFAQAGQADANFYMGLLQERLDRKADAERSYRRSQQLLEHAVQALPNDQLLHQELAECHLHLGAIHQARGELTEAEQEYKQGLMRFMSLVRGNMGPEPRMAMAQAQRQLARVMIARGQRKDAAMALRQAQAFLRPFMRSGSTDGVRYQVVLVRAYDDLGKLLASEGNADDANDQFDRALTLQETIVRQHPDGASYQNDLADLLGERAREAYRQKDYPAAQARLDEALPHHQAALAANPRSTRYRRCFRDNLATRTDVLLALGRHRDAAATAQNMLRFTVEPGSDLYWAACLLSRCVSTAQKDNHLSEHQRQQATQAYTRLAMDTLQRAVAAGFHDRDALTTERALEPLRGRKDFQQLLASLPTTKAAH